MPNYIHKIIVVIINCFVSFVYANDVMDNAIPKFDLFSTSNGLPSSETYHVFEDSKKFIWICTDRGVVRYDGYHFRVFSKKDGLTDEVVFKVFEDYKHRIWFVTMNASLCYFENNRIHPYRFNAILKKRFHNVHIPSKDFYIDKNDCLFLTNLEVGGIMINKNGHVKELHQSNKNIVAFKEFPNHLLRVDRLIKKNNNSSPSFVYLKKKKSTKLLFFTPSITDCQIISFKSNKYNLVCVNNKLFDINKNKILIDSLKICSIYESDKHLYVGTISNGLCVFKKKNKQLFFEKRILNKNTITSILIDHNKKIWVSTLDNGVFFIKNINFNHLSKKEGLIDYGVYSIANSKNVIFIGLSHSRHQQIKGGTQTNHTYFGTEKSILKSFNDKIYTSNSKGFGSLYPISKRLTDFYFLDYQIRGHFAYFVNTTITKAPIIHDQIQFNHLQFLYKRSSYKNNTEQKFDRIYVTEKHQIFLGNLNGLFEFRKGKIVRPNLHSNLIKNRVSDIKESKDWGIIVATRGNGIYSFNGKDIKYKLNEKSGLLTDQITCIHVDSKNRIWLGTNKGVNIVYKKKNKIFIRTLTQKNGLLSNEINSINSFKNNIYICSKKGITTLKSNALTFKSNQNELYLTKVQTNKINIENNAALNHRQNFIDISFRNANFCSSKNPLYAYKISPNGKWFYIKEPKISLMNLSPDSYNIFVKYFDENNQWSKAKNLISFTIKPPFYSTIYFYFFTLISVIILMLLYIKNRTKKLNEKYQLQKTIKNLENKALRAQMNPHFIFNALNSIQSFLVFEENEKAEQFLIKFASLIRLTLTNSRKSLIKVHDEIDLLTRYLDLEQMRFKDKFTFKIMNDLPTDFNELYIPPMLIQPYIENCIIHAFKGINYQGHIEIKLAKHDNKNGIFCTVRDNGIGIFNSKPKLANHTSLGRTITENRLDFYSKILQEKFSVMSTHDTTENTFPGTIIQIEIPIFTDYEED